MQRQIVNTEKRFNSEIEKVRNELKDGKTKRITFGDLDPYTRLHYLVDKEFAGQYGKLCKIMSARKIATDVLSKARTKLTTKRKKLEKQMKVEKNQKELKRITGEWASLWIQVDNITEQISELAEPFKEPAKLRVDAMKSCVAENLADTAAAMGQPLIILEEVNPQRLVHITGMEAPAKPPSIPSILI